VTFAELKAELGDRGFDYLDDDRLGRFINQAYREICNLHAWPFLETTATGAPGDIVISPRKVLWVRDATDTPLRYISYTDLAEIGVPFADTGAPEWWYLLSTGDSVDVMTYPVTTDNITVRYVKRVAPLTGTESPEFDEEYHPLIVDGASIRAYLDNDNFAAASSMREMLDRGLSTMGEDYLTPSRDVQYINVGFPHDG
jgi:hypothetical protein